MPRLIILICLCSFLFIACLEQPRRASSKPPTQTAYGHSIELLNKDIESFSLRAEAMPKSWFALELLAKSYLERARLTGSYQDYANAEAYLHRAFTLSGVGGPHLTQAQLDFSLHRLEGAATNLSVLENAILVDDIKKASIIGIQADLMFFKGEYQKALDGYLKALSLHTDSTALFRLAVFYWRTGEFEQAEKFIDEADNLANNSSPRLNAFFDLHRGLFDLDRERYDEALVHYQAANAAFDGWWLIKEHIAEIYVIQDKLEAAKNIYLDVIAETGNPEFMDAMAGISRPEEAIKWRQKAREVYEEQLTQFPEASYGHALNHYLDVGDMPQKALEIAKANYSLRPYGESAVLLARAHLQVGEIDTARALVEQTLASPWKSVDLYQFRSDP